MKSKFNIWLKEAQALTTEQVEAKGIEEILELHNEFAEIEAKKVDEAIEAKASKEDILQMREEMIKSHNDVFMTYQKQMNETIKELVLSVKKLSKKDK